MPVLVLATVLAVPFVFFTAFHGMPWFDDEGTLMVGFRSWRDGYRMYDGIFSLYGPLYNAIYGLIYVVLRVPLTHTAGRLIASALWLAYTAGFAVFCYNLTRSIATTLFCYVLVLIWLVRLLDSPGHPEEICLLLLVTTLLLACAVEHARRAATLAGIGAAVAGLVLVKINIGAYIGGCLVLALLRITVPSALIRIAIAVVTAGLLLMPLAVEALLFDFLWVKYYCVFSTLVIAAALLVFLNIPLKAVLSLTDWWIIAGGGAVTCLIVVGAMMLAGSSAHAIMNAVVTQNAHFIQNWYVPIHLYRRTLLLAAVSVLAALAYRMSSSRPRLEGYRDLGVVFLKCAFVLAGAVLFAWPGGLFEIPSRVFQTLMPFCWLVMIQPAGIHRPYTLARGVVGLIGATMSLYPFPVASAQIDIAALLPVMMIPILTHDLLTILRHRYAGGLLPAWCRPAFLVVAAVLAIGAAATARSARAYWRAVPLGLPGTSLIRVDAEHADDLRWVTAQLLPCASSYTMPGLFSFAFWTGHFPATAMNNNDVLAFIEPAQQQEIVHALARQPDLCVLYVPAYLAVFDRGQIRADPPLLHYIRNEFVPKSERHGFVILKRHLPDPVLANSPRSNSE